MRSQLFGYFDPIQAWSQNGFAMNKMQYPVDIIHQKLKEAMTHEEMRSAPWDEHHEIRLN